MEPVFRWPLSKRAALPSTDPSKGLLVPVVFVHGYMQNRVDFLGLARRLARRHIGPLYGFNYPWFLSIASNAQRLERYVDRICKTMGVPAVDLICHSMGGLVAMEMMRAAVAGGGRPKVRRCVTIATPHAGVAWKGPMIGFGATSLRRGSKLLETHANAVLEVPTLSLFSSHDNIVHPKETSHLVKRGGKDVEIGGYGHLSILFSPEVADHVASFLAEPGPAQAIVDPDVRSRRVDLPDDEPGRREGDAIGRAD
jgi:triacylglycerol esterase/lipase EstA (alpha/beta hydrolase family)